MRVYDDIKDMLCDELDEITKKKELTSSSLEVIDKSIDIIKDIATIRAMEHEYPSDGYSRDPGYARDPGYYSRTPAYAYDDGASYARRRDSMGRYSRDTMDELRTMMDNAKNEKEREALRKAMDSMKM